MRGRWVRAAAVYAALGLVWWASVELIYQAVGCEEWGCLVTLLGTQAAVSAAVLVGAGYLLRLVNVARAAATGWLAAVLVALVLLGQWVLPVWTDTVPDSVSAVVAFGLSGAAAAVVTERGLPGWLRVLVLLVVGAAVPVTLAWVLATGNG
ncbi:hypothetical protein [Nonomuraea endophytica]|uniref:Uncharacterized protein n=1 Tax=Nonomuraea endophytica TaxID=714136 RepID=A0A7W8EF90_9ACTN|nr:hypothetical protein [Nonomuraea endophytica]MBB5076227.1 hypothetical protein [Nonomuraea endophytica]